MKRVVIESPYAGKSTLPWPLSIIGRWLDRRENERYLEACQRDAFIRYGEAPFASHGLYPGALDDDVPAERNLGINAGFVWGDLASHRAVYTDRGMSFGMKLGIERAKMIGQRVEMRTVPGWRKAKTLPKL
jgi:hypothetical protein